MHWPVKTREMVVISMLDMLNARFKEKLKKVIQSTLFSSGASHWLNVLKPETSVNTQSSNHTLVKFRQ